jgi:hypothetical protein
VPVATSTFSARYGDDLVEIVAGEWATPSHELVRRYPDCFVADRGTAGRRGQRSAGRSLREQQVPASLLDAHERAPASTRTHGRPSLRKGPPRRTVVLGSSARRTIQEEFFSTTRAGGLESGGWLYAPVSRGWDKEIEVRLASTPDKGARSTALSYMPSGEYHAEEKHLADLGSDMVRVGDWHSHTGSNANPSRCQPKANTPAGSSAVSPDALAVLNGEAASQGRPRVVLAGSSHEVVEGPPTHYLRLFLAGWKP